jgi:hypothetical protein
MKCSLMMCQLHSAFMFINEENCSVVIQLLTYAAISSPFLEETKVTVFANKYF